MANIMLKNEGFGALVKLLVYIMYFMQLHECGINGINTLRPWEIFALD